MDDASFFFNDTATTEIYALSLHDALPILSAGKARTLACSAASLFTLFTNASTFCSDMTCSLALRPLALLAELMEDRSHPAAPSITLEYSHRTGATTSTAGHAVQVAVL